MARIKYTWTKDNGQIHRQPEGEQPDHIATLFAGVLIFTRDEAQKKWGHVVMRKCKEWGQTVQSQKVAAPSEGTFSSAPETPVSSATVVAAPLPVAPKTEPVVEDWAKDMDSPVASAIRQLRYKLGYPPSVETNPPRAPRKTSGAGDKTPEFVEWMLRYHPAKFAETYGVERVGSVEKTRLEKNPETERMRKVRYREPGHVLARRVTHLTAKKDMHEEEADNE